MHSDDNSSGILAAPAAPAPAKLTERARREARVAAALRENLLKRKQQARARTAQEGSDSPAAPLQPSADQG